MKQNFTTAFANLQLERFPSHPNSPLQAFDAADEYLLEHLAEQGLSSDSRILILNDSFGALACSLAQEAKVTSSGDSYLAFKALQHNLKSNQISQSVNFIKSSEIFNQEYDFILIRIPKILALLEEQLIKLKSSIKPTSQIIASGMIKHLPRAAGDLLEKYIGPVQASLAQKKSRLLFCTPQARATFASPYPTRYTLKNPPFTLLNHAGVFCREGLDIGTQAFLPHLPQGQEALKVADLGCGNGVIGLTFAYHNPQAQLYFVDESFMAVQSAQDNWQTHFPSRSAEINAADGLADITPDSLDIILCNPPFHQQQVIGDFLAKSMFKQAQIALKSGGELWIVGNRHLGYHQILKRYFAKVDLISSNAKFVILKALKK